MESAKKPMSGLGGKVRFLFLQAACAAVDLVTYAVPTLVARLVPSRWCSPTSTPVRWGGSASVRDLFQLDVVLPTLRGLPRWFMSGHTHTILCAFRPAMPVAYKRVRTPGGDGNTMCLDWAMADPNAGTVKGVLLIVPGLASSAETNYIQRFVTHACASGFHCCVSTSRGLGDTPLERPQLMAACWTADLRTMLATGALTRDAVMHQCGLEKPLPMIGLGFSLGGIFLAKYAGEEGQANRQTALDAVITVDSPLDCLASNLHMSELLGRILYQPSMTGGLLSYARRHVDMLKKVSGLPADVHEKLVNGETESVFRQIRTVYDYDLFLTAPANGYTSPEAYYADLSGFKWLRWSKIPALCVCTADDPCCGPTPMDQLEETVKTNTQAGYVVLPRGGHLGCVMSPRAEWQGKPTALERLLGQLCTAFCSQRQQVSTP